jgi:2-polyprenyl-6-methoxyphenol hydroxylase-like FAD-dependent oxidoreductase
MGLWQKIISTGRPAPFRRMIVWDAVGQGRIVFDAQQMGSPYMGYIVENDVMHSIMLEHLRERVSDHFSLLEAHVLEGVNPSDSDQFGGSPSRLLVKSSPMMDSEKASKEFTCHLLIGADGFDSSVRRLTGLESVGWDYRQSAIVATMNLATSNDDDKHYVAWQRFLPSGPIAMLPVSKCGKAILDRIDIHPSHFFSFSS